MMITRRWSLLVAIIQEYFNKDKETAMQIMLKVHVEGRGVCGSIRRM